MFYLKSFCSTKKNRIDFRERNAKTYSARLSYFLRVIHRPSHKKKKVDIIWHNVQVGLTPGSQTIPPLKRMGSYAETDGHMIYRSLPSNVNLSFAFQSLQQHEWIRDTFLSESLHLEFKYKSGFLVGFLGILFTCCLPMLPTASGKQGYIDFCCLYCVFDWMRWEFWLFRRIVFPKGNKKQYKKSSNHIQTQGILIFFLRL